MGTSNNTTRRTVLAAIGTGGIIGCLTGTSAAEGGLFSIHWLDCTSARVVGSSQRVNRIIEEITIIENGEIVEPVEQNRIYDPTLPYTADADNLNIGDERVLRSVHVSAQSRGFNGDHKVRRSWNPDYDDCVANLTN